MKFKILVEQAIDGYFVAHCPVLKSCWTQGKTMEETIENMKEATTLYLEDDSDSIQNSTNNSSVYELVI